MICQSLSYAEVGPGRLPWLDTLLKGLVALLLLGTVNVLFLVPDGDRYLFKLMALTALVGLARRAVQRDWTLQVGRRFIFPLTAYALVLFFSNLFLSGFGATVKTYLVGTLLLYAIAPLRLRGQWLSLLLIFGGIEFFAFACYQVISLGVGRFHGYTHPIFMGIFCMTSAAMALFLSRRMEGMLKPGLWLATLTFFLAALLSSTRGVVIAIPFILLMFTWLCWKEGQVKVSLLPWVMAIVITPFFNPAMLNSAIHSESMIGKMGTALNEAQAATEDEKYATSIGFRLMMWQFCIYAFEQSPIYGLGRDGVEKAKQEYVDQGLAPETLLTMVPKAHAHNQYFQELAQRGLIGLAALLLVFSFSVREAWERIQAQRWSGFALAMLIGAFMIYCLTEVALKHPIKVDVFLIFGWFLHQYHDDESPLLKGSAS
ncbi:O-antigen ligase family protein [Pokkaliibacter sp. CJK22405]|uniref:O-antigen ligase family protein n=1 Tax=Pokkaliibacter sp. CJK22405 TaxID=3384615 RepID=UPI003985195E